MICKIGTANRIGRTSKTDRISKIGRANRLMKLNDANKARLQSKMKISLQLFGLFKQFYKIPGLLLSGLKSGATSRLIPFR